MNMILKKFGKAAVLQCHGRITKGNKHDLLRVAGSGRNDIELLVLDLQRVEVIDAGGLGALLEMHIIVRARGMRLKFVNVINRVRQIFELTRLDRIFEFCSVEEMYCVLLAQGKDDVAAGYCACRDSGIPFIAKR